MKRRMLVAYQLMTGFSDTFTGLLLVFAPAFTLGLMRLRAPADALPFVSFIGAFVISMGLACLYGALVAWRMPTLAKIEVVWLLTAVTRSAVASFLFFEISTQALERGWVFVAFSDGLFALIQVVGLAKGWLRNAGV